MSLALTLWHAGGRAGIDRMSVQGEARRRHARVSPEQAVCHKCGFAFTKAHNRRMAFDNKISGVQPTGVAGSPAAPFLFVYTNFRTLLGAGQISLAAPYPCHQFLDARPGGLPCGDAWRHAESPLSRLADTRGTRSKCPSPRTRMHPTRSRSRHPLPTAAIPAFVKS